MTSRTNKALASLRQIAALGLPPAVVFDDMMACLKDVVPFDSANIILLNQDYSPRDFLATFNMPPAVSQQYAERWFNGAEAMFYPSHIRLQNDPSLRVIRVSDFSPDFGQTELYDEIMRHAEHERIAGVTCREGGRVVGNLGLGRPGARKDFTAEELLLFDAARPFLTQALAARDTVSEGPDARAVEIAMLCADIDGTVLTESPNAWRLLRHARDVPLDMPLLDNIVYAWARPLLADLARRVHAALTGGLAAPAVLRSANRYGEFVLRAYALTPTSTDVRSGVGVQIERRLPATVILFRSPVFRSLSNRERAVAQGLVTGATNAEIAAEMGVQVSTVITHARNLYARLDVRNRAALAQRLYGQEGLAA